MNRRLENNQDKADETEVSDKEAFQKGNEFIIEFILLYGILGGMAIIETKRQVALNR